MPLSLVQTVAPVAEPITIDEAKSYLRIDGTADDAVIEALLTAAREEVEVFTGRQLLSATYALRMEAFPTTPGCLRLPRPPLQSVTSITYLDADNVSQTLATTVYAVDIYQEPGRIALKPNQSWPATVAGGMNTVTITFVAGYSGTTLPERARMAIKLLLGDYYEHREAQLDARIYGNETVQRLLWGLRLLSFT